MPGPAPSSNSHLATTARRTSRHTLTGLVVALRIKADAMVDAVQRTNSAARFTVAPPMGGIYVWLTFPEGTDTDALAAGSEGCRHRVQRWFWLVQRLPVG